MTHEHDRQPDRAPGAAGGRDAHPEWAPEEEVQAHRLAEALDALDAGHESGVDPREDPELASLLSVAGSLRDSLHRSTETASYRSYRNRSRSVILHALEPKQPASEKVLPFYRRWTWTTLAPAASAAAAATMVFAVIGGGIALVGGPDAGDTPRNLTVATLEEHLGLLATSVQEIQLRADRGETVPREALLSFAERQATMAQRLQQQRERGVTTTSPETVVRVRTAAEEAREVLNRTQPEAGGEAALVTAQIANEEVVTAARFLEETPTATAEPEPTAAATTEPMDSPSASPTATPSPAATIEPTPTPGDEDGAAGDGEPGGPDGTSPGTPTPVPPAP